MKFTQSRTTVTATHLQAKSEEQRGTFFQPEESRGSFFGSKQSHEPFFKAATPAGNNPKPATIRAKLSIGALNKVYEQETDDMAYQFVQKPNFNENRPDNNTEAIQMSKISGTLPFMQEHFRTDPDSGPLRFKTNHLLKFPDNNALTRSVESQSGQAAPGDASWDRFANRFNDEFTSILHVFEPEPRQEGSAVEGTASSPRTRATPGGNTPGSQSGPGLDIVQFQRLFTETQRDKLMSFMLSRIIPERLFNGDDVGNTTAQQRLLMSAHILANGNYRPGSFEQRVHARMCFHWVQIVHHYAGVTPAGILNAGVMGSFDNAGNIVLGAGSSESVFVGERVFADDLPAAEGARIGPVPESTGHGTSADLEAQQRAGNPLVRQQVHRRYAFPIDRFDELRPGDWLWYYNANSSAGGSHSVIFSRWASPRTEVDGVPFRTAIAFSQGTPGAGGRAHTVRLGEQFHRSGNISIYPITNISRVSETALLPSTVEELLPASPGRREQQLQARNRRLLGQIERRYHRPVDLERVKNHLQAENREHLSNLSSRLTEGQQRLLNQANSHENLETLIRLTERLRALDINAAILERNMASTFDENLTARHTEASRRQTEERQRLDAQIGEIDRELEPIQAQIDTQNTQLETLDPSPEIRRLRRQSGSIWRTLQSMTRRNPDYESLRAERQEILVRIREVQNQQISRRREVQEVRAAIRQLQQRTRPLEQRRRRLLRQQNRRRSPLPYGLVHPGRLAGESRAAASGRLDKLFTINGMRQFLVEAGPEQSNL